MSNLVKIILFVAFAIFAVGFIWAIVVAVKKPKETVKETTNTTSQTTTPSPAPAPAPAPAPSVAAAPAPATTTNNTVRRQTVTRRYIIRTENSTAGNSSVDLGDGTWARAGVDANGNAYAEAYAN